jgi:hypothetical protein
VFLQRFDLKRKGGGGDIQLLCRTGKGHVAGRCFKSAKGGERGKTIRHIA